MAVRRFEDLAVGDRIDCGTTDATRAEMIAFAERFDPLDMHVDERAATDTVFGGIIASGFYTLALTQPPVVEHLYEDSTLIASGGMTELQFPAPLRPEDSVSVSIDVLDKRTSTGNPVRGVLTTKRTATVDEKVVLDLVNETIWQRNGEARE